MAKIEEIVENPTEEKVKEMFPRQITTKNTNVKQSGPSGDSQPGSVEALKTTYIINALQGLKSGKSIPFCVARALQLVNSTSLDKLAPQKVVSRICQTKFDQGRGMIPNTDESLTVSNGFHSLNQLYYTQPSAERDQAGAYSNKVKVGNIEEYAGFLDMMRQTFTSSVNPISSQTKLSDLKFAKPKCDATQMGKLLNIEDPVVIQNLFQTINALFNIQKNNAVAVVNFLRTKLVLINKTLSGQSTIQIHPDLLKGGIAQLNIISAQARNLLVNYYMQCEKTYQLGASLAVRSGKIL
jgi:hypothetical protein